jgi:predicted GNAT family acetyltransferase
METINMLQSEPTPEPIIDIEKPIMHPLLQAMQELHEEGVVEYVNKDTVQPDFTVEKEIQNGYILKAQGLENGEGIEIKVFDPENVFSNVPIADATFKLNNDDKTLTSSLTTVHHKYQKQGIARAMYQFVHDLGNDIQASKTLLPGGQRMWDAFGSTFNNEPKEPQAQSEKKSLWQRLFKEADAIDEEIAYHGTTDDIAEFHPLSHFGTEKAAKDRMTYKKIKDGKIYKVDLDIKNPLTIKDFPGIHYDRLYAFELRDKKLISQKEMEAITTIDDKAELRKALLTKLNELGIDGFVYKNKYEDKGNISYVIVDPRQVKVLSVESAAEEVTEASPNTLEGSFTPDLVESKTWLAEMLAKGLKGKNAGTIYVLGSWYGNMGIFLQQAGIKFDKLVLIEPDEDALMRSKDLLQQIGDEGKLILIHQKAEDAVYEKPGVVINTSCNETGPVFLTKLPDNMLCLLQARNNNENTLFPTEDEEDFIDYFPLETVYYTGKKQLEDPEINYVRYMKIGRTGKKLDEEFHTGGSLGTPYPGTYEQEYDMFKSKGPRRITATTNEALDSAYPYEFKNNAYYFITDAGTDYKVTFKGDKKVEVSFMARGENNQPKDDITGTGDSRKVFGTVINIVKDYVGQHQPDILMFAADNNEPSRIRLYNMLASQAGKALPGYNFVKTLKGSMFTTFYLTRDNIKVPKLDTVKNAAGRVLDKVVED